MVEPGGGTVVFWTQELKVLTTYMDPALFQVPPAHAWHVVLTTCLFAPEIPLNLTLGK